MKKNIFKNVLPLLLMLSIGLFVQVAHAVDVPESLAGVKNISHPASNRFGAGQPEPEMFAEFAKAGVKHVINLRPPSETPELNQAAIVTKAGMAYYNVPIRGKGDLTRDNVMLLDNLLKKIGDESVLVHCASSNRVGALMALKAAWFESASPDEAIVVGKDWGLKSLQRSVKQRLQE